MYYLKRQDWLQISHFISHIFSLFLLFHWLSIFCFTIKLIFCCCLVYSPKHLCFSFNKHPDYHYIRSSLSASLFSVISFISSLRIFLFLSGLSPLPVDGKFSLLLIPQNMLFHFHKNILSEFFETFWDVLEDESLEIDKRLVKEGRIFDSSSFFFDSKAIQPGRPWTERRGWGGSTRGGCLCLW